MRRTLRALALATLTLALAAPASTVALVPDGVTVRVDDDGTAGAASCNGTDPAPTSIQDAVDSVGTNSTILVCPGTYVGQVLVEGSGLDGLTIHGVQPWKATIRPPAEDFLYELLQVDGTDRVTIRSLRFVLPARSGTCRYVSTVIHFRGALKARILANRIVAKGSDTIDCGYGTGVKVEGISDGPRARGTVAWNLIQDFRSSGIEMCRIGKSRIHRNSIRFLHRGVASDELDGKGIYIQCSSEPGPVRITDNVITSPPTAQVTTPALIEGMFIEGSTTEVSGNRVVRAQVGIFVAGREQAPVLEDNVLVGTLVDPRPFTKGIRAHAVDFPVTIRSNTISSFGTGIDVFSGADSVITQNDVVDNDTPCLDSSGQTNTWTDNLGCPDGPVIED